MKILERKEPPIIVNCPCCGSKLELEKGDIWWYGGNSPRVTCAVCHEGFNVEGCEGIDRILG